jgi:hypothetical protein
MGCYISGTSANNLGAAITDVPPAAAEVELGHRREDAH